MNREKQNILVFCSREICYCSGNFFAHQLGAAFEELGFEVQVCEFTKEDDLDRVLEPFAGKRYRAILDFNSL
ncbi:MAG: glycosyltransferase family 1 protein, partial [Clostridiales bacterium]|nr:glycosyltransferase family 1 protein [Clostridiales bacterium]